MTLVGSPRLAELAEAELKGEPVGDADIAAEIAPCFVEADGERTDTVVLACTHYPLLLDRLETARALAGEFHRPGAGHRPPRGRSARARRTGAPRRCRPARFHLGPGARTRARPRRLAGFGLAEAPQPVFDTPRLSP